jgi:hypothetical protein
VNPGLSQFVAPSSIFSKTSFRRFRRNGEKCKYPFECPESRHDGLTSDILERYFAFWHGRYFLHLDGIKEFEWATMTRIGALQDS